MRSTFEGKKLSKQITFLLPCLSNWIPNKGFSCSFSISISVSLVQMLSSGEQMNYSYQLQLFPFVSSTSYNMYLFLVWPTLILSISWLQTNPCFFSALCESKLSQPLYSISHIFSKYKPLGRLFLLPLGALVIFVCPRLDFDVAFALNDYMVIIYRIYCLVHCCNSFDWVLLQSAVCVDAQILPRLWIFSLFQFQLSLLNN